jgi:hypothetical protein
VLNLHNDEPVARRLGLRFGVDGGGVCAAAKQAECAGRLQPRAWSPAGAGVDG